MEELPEGAERVDPGITIDPAETVFVSTLADFDNPHEVSNEAFDVGVPVSLGGSTYGLAALSTPTASVLGQSVNPVVNVETSASAPPLHRRRCPLALHHR